MIIYLLPWKFDIESGMFKRRRFGKEEVVIASIWKEASNGKWYSSHLNTEESFFEEICEKVDKCLSTYRDFKTDKKYFYLIKQNELGRFENKLKLLL